MVCGIDDSDASQLAADTAAALARRERRTLCLLHAYRAPSVVRSRGGPRHPEDLPTLVHQEAETLLNDSALRIRSEFPDVEVVTALRDEDPRAALEHAASLATLVVVGSRGGGGFPRLRIGSVSLWVSQHAECPTVVVRPGAVDDATAPILVGTDTSEVSANALDFAFAQASFQGRRLVVIHCFDEYYERGYSLVTVSEEAMEGLPDQRLAVSESLAGLREKYPDVEVHLEFGRGPAGPYLVRASKDADLLVVGSRQLSRLAALVAGTVSRGTVEHAACSVAVVPAAL